MNEKRDGKTGSQRMGMDESRLQDAWKVIDREIDRREIPGAVAVVARNGHTAEYAAGWSVDGAGVRYPVTIDTVYDCASITKIAVTLPLSLLLLDRGLLSLEDRVTQWLPEFASNGKDKVTVKHLLAHTAGLKAPPIMYTRDWKPNEIIPFICGLPPLYDPGTDVLYSCLSFILLGHIASQIWGVPLDFAAEEHIFRPLGMTCSRYNPPPEWKTRIAATEYNEQLGRQNWGSVHDEIARALGGVSGNAGLFSTAHDLTRYAQMWLAGGRAGSHSILSQAVMEEAVRTQTPMNIRQANRGLGWVLKGDVQDASGDLLSPSTYGHTGFTGTSLYIDPVRSLTVVLLTNRVHYGRDKSVSGLRARFHNAIAAAVVEPI